jgi:hypothetical protein
MIPLKWSRKAISKKEFWPHLDLGASFQAPEVIVIGTRFLRQKNIPAYHLFVNLHINPYQPRLLRYVATQLPSMRPKRDLIFKPNNPPAVAVKMNNQPYTRSRTWAIFPHNLPVDHGCAFPTSRGGSNFYVSIRRPR